MAGNYLDELAQSSGGYPTGIGSFPDNKLSPKYFTDRQKARLLSEVQKHYLSKGNLSPIEKFGQASASAMAQSDKDF